MLLSNCEDVQRVGAYVWFQSLFYWMLLSNIGVSFNSLRIRALFQSLFYWMLLSNGVQNMETDISSISFNPCFIGCYSLTPRGGGRVVSCLSVVSILVLLDVTL